LAANIDIGGLPGEVSGSERSGGERSAEGEDTGGVAGEATGGIGTAGDIGEPSGAAELTTSIEELITQAKPSAEVRFACFKN
jgi:hypothetical protein